MRPWMKAVFYVIFMKNWLTLIFVVVVILSLKLHHYYKIIDHFKTIYFRLIWIYLYMYLYPFKFTIFNRPD